MKKIFLFIVICCSVMVTDAYGQTQSQITEIILDVAEEKPAEEALQLTSDIIIQRLSDYGYRNLTIDVSTEGLVLRVDLGTATDPDQIIPLLTSTGNIAFCETFQASEIFEAIEVNDKISSFNKTEHPNSPVIGYAAKEEFPLIDKYFHLRLLQTEQLSNAAFAWSKFPEDNGKFGLYALKYAEDQQPIASGKQLESATATLDEKSGQYSILINFDEEGTRLWSEGTEKNLGRTIAIVVDQRVYFAPRVMAAITHGKAMITGQFSDAEARQLASIIDNGTLPLKITIKEIRN